MQRKLIFTHFGLLLGLLAGIVLALLSIRLASAQTPEPAAPADLYWQAAYWDNMYLAGAPMVERGEPVLDHDWGAGSPDVRIPDDHFSARWTTLIDVPAGRYRFSATSDDGIRVTVDSRRIIDRWYDHPRETFTAEIDLPAGQHWVQVEFYENEGFALAQVSWQPVWGIGQGDWYGEYYNNRDLRGSPSWVRNDRRIAFDWEGRSPAPGVYGDYFSARWTQTRYFREGRYRFTTETDDGVRLWVDGNLLIDRWYEMARAKHTRETDLWEGYHAVRVEYFQAAGDSYIRVTWKRVEREEPGGPPVGNIITCVPPQPAHCAWIKVYRWDPSGFWADVSAQGFASCNAAGFLKIDGLPVDMGVYGEAGHPYWVEQWIDGQLTQSTGNFQRGEPTFLVRPYADNYTPWQCAPA